MIPLIPLAQQPNRFEGFWKDLANYQQEILTATREHLTLTLAAMAIAVAVAVPLGIALARCRNRSLVQIVMGLAGVIQTVPALALIAVTMTVLILLNTVLNMLPIDLQFRLIGTGPALVVLVAYALLPVLRNTFTGIGQVDEAIIDVARGMGMTDRQILVKIQLPLAMPFVMAGIRIATVWTIGIATLVTFIGAGGLGDQIYTGLTTRRPALLVGGMVPAVLMALLLDFLLGLIEKFLTPRGAQTASRA
jgi:osmoprotectant transport system permease protein